MNARQKTTWDCVWFGRYPQSEVTEESNPSLYYKLEQEGWKTNEVTLNGTLYRKIGSRFFQSDPIKWRVLETDGDTALLLSDVSLDGEPYNITNVPITWERSTIRSWLNGYDELVNTSGVNYSKGNFIDTAFTGAEQAAIINSQIVNEDHLLYGTEGGNDTVDKLFLLSESDVCMKNQAVVHGFVKDRDVRDEARRSKASSYAKAIDDYNVGIYWTLRSPNISENYALHVDSKDGRVDHSSCNGTVNVHLGVRVALRLNLASDLYSYAGTVSSADMVDVMDFQPTTQMLTIPKDSTAEQIVNKMDMAHLIDSVSLPAETIEGPSITIAGKKFSLFSLDGSLKFPFGDNVQAKVDEEKKQVQVLVGFDKFDGSAKIEAGENSSAYWSESYRQVKELYTGVSGKKVDSTALWNKFSKLRGKLKPVQGSIGLSASASVAGYMEFSYATGELKLSEGGVILEASLGTEQTYHLPPFPAVYVTFEAKAGFNGTVRLVRQGVMRYAPAMDASISLAATLGAGVGSNKLKTYAEIGLQGKMNLGVKLPADALSNALSAKLTAYAYIESKIFGFDGPSWGPEKFVDMQLYPHTKNARKARSLFGGADVAAFDWEEAELSGREYLSGASTQARTVAADVSFEKNSLYPYNAPQLAAFEDGRKLLVWIDDLGEKAGINKTSLLYSLYDGSAWGTPQILAETGGANDYPALYADGERAWLLWQKAPQMPENASLPELLSGVELYLAVWEDGSFGDAQQVTADNDRYEMLQSVTSSDGRVAAAWVENAENDPFQSDGVNVIKIKEYTDGQWQERTAASGLASVSNLHTAYIDGELTLAYEAELDGISSVYLLQGSRKRQFTGSNAELAGGVLYFNGKDGVTAYDIAGEFREVLIREELGDFTVLCGENGRAIVTTARDGFASELRAYVFDQETGTWSEGITLAGEGKYIRDYSLVGNGAGKLSAALNLVEVHEGGGEVYGSASLQVMDLGENEDLVMGAVSYDESLVTPGGALPLEFSVTNNGLHPVPGFRAEIRDQAGTVLLSGTVPCALAPGETADASCTYQLPGNLKRHEISVTVYTEKETKREDNTAFAVIGYADLALAGLHFSGSGSQVRLAGRVQNLGYEPAADTVVTVYEFSKEGAVIGSVKLGEIASQGSVEFSLAIPEAYTRVHPDLGGNALYVQAESPAEELRLANNGESVLVQSSEDEPLLLNASELTMNPGDSQTLEITCFRDGGLSGQTVAWASSDARVVTVENGNLTAVAPGTAQVTARVGAKEASCAVRVLAGAPVTGVCLEETSIRLAVGEGKKLSTSVLPANAANQKVAWESSDSSVAVVGADGTVRGMAVGTALITVRSEDGNKTALCSVTVVLGENQMYTASFAGGGSTAGTDPSAIIQKPGTLITLPENTYRNGSKYFAGWSDGGNSYKNGDTYRMPYHDVAFTAQWESEPVLEYPILASAQAGGTIAPEGEISVLQGQGQPFAIRAEEGYEIKDVQVDGGSVGAVENYAFKNVSGKHRITAIFEKVQPVKVQGITLDRTEHTMKAGETVLLLASVLPDGAENKVLSWESSDEKTASVDGGLVTALAAGTTMITASSTDGSGVSASCVIRVEDHSGGAGSGQTPGGTQDPGGSGSGQTPGNPGGTQNPGGSGSGQIPGNPGGTQNPGGSGGGQNPDGSGGTQNPGGSGNGQTPGNQGGTQSPTVVLKTGAKVTDRKTKAVYKILGLSSKTVEYVKSKSTKTSLTVPNTVSLGGKKFTVTAVAKAAFKGNKKVKSITIGTKVKTIGDKAFYGCKSLKKITIKSKVLKKVGKNALKGIHGRAKIKVPKTRLKAYRKLLKKKGQGKKVTISK